MEFSVQFKIVVFIIIQSTSKKGSTVRFWLGNDGGNHSIDKPHGIELIKNKLALFMFYLTSGLFWYCVVCSLRIKGCRLSPTFT